MSDRATLERNKAVLWARDIVSRDHECWIASSAEGVVVLTSLQGAEMGRCNLLDGKQPLEQFVQTLNGKELVAAGVPDSALQLLRGRGVVIHDLLFYYRIYVDSPTAQLSEDVQSHSFVTWVRESLHKMASSSLVLDQADTGAGRWTSSHFKPQPSVFDKLKSIIKP